MREFNTFDLNKYYPVYYRKSYSFAKSYVHDQWIAEDIASEAMAILWETMSKNKIHHPLTFLFSIVKNKAIDYLRREITRQEMLSNISDIGIRELNTRIYTLEACDPQKIYSEEIQQIIDNTLKSLPKRTQEIFQMSRFQGYTKEEIAKEFAITSKGVEYHISKALHSLRIGLEDYLPLFIFFFLY